MGKFYSALISATDVTQRATSISNWIDSLEGFSSTVVTYSASGSVFTSAKITLDDTNIEVLFGIVANTINGTIVYVKNGDIKLLPDNKKGPSGAVADIYIGAYIDENCRFLSIRQRQALNESNGVEVLYLTTSTGNNLIGYGKNDTGTSGSTIDSRDILDVSSLVFEDVDDSARIPYKYTNMFPYVASAGTIDFITKGFFVDGNQYKQFETEALRECSTVTLLSTQSLPTGNCVALGAHCLAPLDDEE
jgi:hypothetical protein